MTVVGMAHAEARRNLHRRPVFATMMILALVVVGAAAYAQLGVDRFPSVDLPTVSVRTSLPGASPEEVESEVSERIEEAVNTVEGIRSCARSPAQGSSFVDRHVRSRTATSTSRRRTCATAWPRSCASLPDDVDPPVVSKFDNDSTPVLTIALSGDRRAARADRDRRQDRQGRSSSARPASARSQIVGGLERAINVWVDADRLAAYQIPITRRARRGRAAERRRPRRQRHRRSRASRRCARWAGSPTRAAFNDLVVATRQRRADPRSATSAGPRTAPRSSAPWRG